MKLAICPWMGVAAKAITTATRMKPGWRDERTEKPEPWR